MKQNRSSIEEELSRPAGEVSIIKVVNALIQHAYEMRASDIHIDPEEDRIRVRLRIDGVLYNVFAFPKEIQSEIITRIKVMSGLRTDEHQIAQDGRTRYTPHGEKKSFDIRVSIAPTYYDENAVLRLLSDLGRAFALDNIGFSEKDHKTVAEAITRPNGMILATGPTGSGKTTTLYTILKTLNTEHVAIITAEDPVEYSIGGITQIQVNTQTDLTFANALRSILRQDPNIIMVGEVRDEDTAKISVNAALTGHLLLSTIHTNNAATTLPRLLEMGAKPFLIASTVNIAIAQRLVRKICQECKEEWHPTINDIQAMGEVLADKFKEETPVFYRGKGCDICGGSGYYGRIGIYEVLEVTDAIREAIMKRLNADEIEQIAIHEGMTTMLDDGMEKAKQGITSIEEVLRVMHE